MVDVVSDSAAAGMKQPVAVPAVAGLAVGVLAAAAAVVVVGHFAVEVYRPSRNRLFQFFYVYVQIEANSG